MISQISINYRQIVDTIELGSYFVLVLVVLVVLIVLHPFFKPPGE